jgi:hypothetical protein
VAASSDEAAGSDVIVTLTGGLGNQLFQYAAGLALSRRLGVGLTLDVGAYRRDRLRRFSLEPILHPEVTVADHPRWRVRLRRRVGRREPPPFRPDNAGWDPAFAGIAAPVRLHGTCASPRYFAEVGETVRREFTGFPLESEAARALRGRVAAGEMCAVHVRRGDYLKNAKRLRKLGLKDRDYYARAIDEVRARAGHDLTVVVFSDEPNAARTVLDGLVRRVVVAEGTHDTEDLVLMAACDHHVIANSTFSWWGAWLATSPHQLVVAPARWFAQHPEPRDLIPADWMRR